MAADQAATVLFILIPPLAFLIVGLVAVAAIIHWDRRRPEREMHERRQP